MLLIYTIKSTRRLKYVLELIFEHILGLQVSYTQDKNTFLKSNLPKINYSSTSFDGIICFRNIDLLFEDQIKQQNIKIDIYKNKPAFFFHGDKNAILPFDPFALIFYLVTRYEEYTATSFDHHGRFAAAQSIAFQHSFLDRPLVNEWILVIKDILKESYPNLLFKESKYEFTATYDIDYAWSYKHKGFFRILGATARDFLKNRKQLAQRINVLKGKEEDPYFTFDYLDHLHERFGLKPIYFFLVGKRGTYDKNISIKQKAFQQLIDKIAQRYKIGLHPSYASNTAFKILKEEQSDLEKTSKQLIQKSRQHFLKLSFPTTYRNLIRLGVTADYSMGYAAQLGFRASIASSFLWFDLEKNEKTDLEIFPFQLMDVTLKDYLKLSAEEAIEATNLVIENTKKVDGQLMTLFHNNSLCEQEGWEGWREVYESILEKARLK